MLSRQDIHDDRLASIESSKWIAGQVVRLCFTGLSPLDYYDLWDVVDRAVALSDTAWESLRRDAYISYLGHLMDLEYTHRTGDVDMDGGMAERYS